MIEPPYVSWRGHGQVSLPAPGVFTDSLTTFFFIPADPAHTQPMVDTLLNAAPRKDVRYEVFGAYAMVVFLSVGRMTTPGEPFGWIPYREASIWLPLVEYRDGHWPRFVAWMPYVFPDASIPLVCGREGYGFNKSIGRISLPSDDGATPRYVCETTVFKTMTSDCQGQVLPLFSVAGGGGRGGLWSTLKDLVDGVRDLLPARHATRPSTRQPSTSLATDAALIVSGIESLLTGTVRLTNLMQFRTPADSARACYQAIVDCPMKVDRFLGAWPLSGPWTVEVADVASHQVINDLGLPASGHVDVDLALQVHMDFRCDNGEVLWQAGAG